MAFLISLESLPEQPLNGLRRIRQTRLSAQLLKAGFTAALAIMFKRQVSGGGKKIGAQGGTLRIIAARLFDQAQKAIVGDVFSQFKAPQHAPGKAKHGIPMRLIHQQKGGSGRLAMPGLTPLRWSSDQATLKTSKITHGELLPWRL